MRYLYQKFHEYFAQVQGGVEEWACRELQELGAESVHGKLRAVRFKIDSAGLYRVNYCSRLSMRVLAPLAGFDCHSPDYLYRRAREIDWQELLGLDDTFAVFANVANSRIRHSRYAALKLKDAIVDSFRDQTGQRPNVDARNPDSRFHLYIQGNHATISLDTSGESLHRRGYRRRTIEAPMQETLAAAILRITGWDGKTPLADPMCGSGTILAEAWMLACNIPAGYLRKRFGFERLPDFSSTVWEQVKGEADGAIRLSGEAVMLGRDIDAEAIRIARDNLSMLPGGGRVQLEVKDFRGAGPLHDYTIVCNPPYGIRLNKGRDSERLIKQFGDYLKQQCAGSTAYVYFGNRELLKQIGLRTSGKWALSNGGLDGRLAQYRLY